MKRKEGDALKGRVQLIAITWGMLRSSTSSGALTSVRPALRSFLALRMRSAGRYVSGTRVMRRTYSTAAQLRKKNEQKRKESAAAPLAHGCLSGAYMMSVYHVHLQLVFWLMKPEMSGPETGPTARLRKRGSRFSSAFSPPTRILLHHEGESETHGMGPQCTLPSARRLRVVERYLRSCRPPH